MIKRVLKSREWFMSNNSRSAAFRETLICRCNSAAAQSGLGELDEWLRKKDAQRDKRESFIVGAIADIVAAVFRVLTFFR